MKQYLEAGEFVTTHGVLGELKLYPWSDEPDFLAGFSEVYFSADGQQPVRIEKARPHKTMCIVKLEGVESIEQARPFIGKTVWINRQEAELAPGQFFVQDLLGARVLDADTGEEYGRVVGVSHPGRHDIYEIEGPAGQTYLFPAVEAFLVKRDIEAGEVLVRPIPGMFTQPEGGEVKPPPPNTRRNKPQKEKPEHDPD